MTTENSVYELLEESLASKQAIQAFFAGYRLLYSTEDIWSAIQRLYNNYGDVESLREYIWYGLTFWFTHYCRHDLKYNRKIANEVFAFTSRKFKDKELTSQLKILFVEKIADDLPPTLNIPARADVFSPRIEYYTSSFTTDDFVKTVGAMAVNLFRFLPLDISIQDHQIIRTIASFFDHITYHVASHITWGKTARIRAREAQFFIKVADKFHRGRNYEMTFAIYQGLIQPSIKKLTRTWKKVSHSHRKLLEGLETLFDIRDGYAMYQEEVRNLKGPYIPVCSVLFRQINSAKMNSGSLLVKAMGKLFHNIAMVQSRKMASPNPQLEKIVLLPSLSANKLAELVLLRENPNGKSSDSSDSDYSPRGEVYSDHELSPEPSPRCQSPRFNIPNLQLPEGTIFTHSSPPSPLKKSTSFYGREISPEPHSPRPATRSTITRTKAIRTLRELYGDCLPNSKKNIDTWTPAQVLEWLKEINMEQYGTIFLGGGITGDKLTKLSSRNLLELGVEKKNHRKDILREIKNLPT